MGIRNFNLPPTTINPKNTDIHIQDVNLTENVTIKGDPNLVPSNIVNNTSIFGVTGTMVGNSGKGSVPGTGLWSSGTVTAVSAGAGSLGCTFTVSGLGFTPTMIYATTTLGAGVPGDQTWDIFYHADLNTTDFMISNGTVVALGTQGTAVTNGGFTLGDTNSSNVGQVYYWKACAQATS